MIEMMNCMRLLLGRESKCIYDLVKWPEARSLYIFIQVLTLAGLVRRPGSRLRR